MKKLFLFAAVAGLGLVSAGPPDKDDMAGPPEARGNYPPCSRTVTDSCIQRERGARAQARTAHAGHHRACAAHCVREHRRLAHRIRRAGERG